MGFVTASSLMTGFGATPELAPGSFALSSELGSIPWLDEAQQQVGFGGIKDEDLNKSPAFGRVRAWIGLPAGFVAELAWTPPVEINGASPGDVFAIGFGRRWIDREPWSLSTRVHGQVGRVSGDITCPADIAGNLDPVVNPYRCVEPSNDRIQLRYHALEATGEYAPATSGWRGHATLGFARYEPRVQVNARSPVLTSIPRLSTRGSAPYLALGGGWRFERHWELASEVLYVPLEVRRDEDGPPQDDSFWSLRLMLRYRFVD
jgi:hypothetical protein